MAEWNAHKPSTITDIQKRADSIDQTSWMCAGMEQIPQYVNCRCMACGSMITGRYTVVKWTFKDKPVSLIICGSCGDRHRREIDSARSKIKGAIKQSAQDFVDAGQLDSANKFVQGQIERVRKMCSDSEVPFPSPSKQSKKAAKQQAAPPKPRTETPASGTSGRTAECAEAKKSLNWGIASLLFGVLAAIPAVIYGHKALRKIKQSNGTLGGRAKAQAGLVIGYAIIIITAVMIWYLAVEQPAQKKLSFEEAVALDQQQAAVQKSAEDKAKADVETAQLAEEKRKTDELAAQKAADEKAAQELAANQAADEKAKADAEASRLAEEKRKADELAVQKVAATTIFDATRDNDLEKVRALIKDHPDLAFSKDDNGVTPLHYAAAMGSEDMAELLLTNRADVNAKANNGMTPLHAAAAMGHRDVVELLLANKADVNVKNNKDWTPLRYATENGHTDVVELLREHGGDE
jgi:hypothetical protein